MSCAVHVHKYSQMRFVKHWKPTESPLPQATSPTRPCPPQGSCHGSRESFVMPTTPVFNTPPVVNLLAWCPTTTTPCKHHLGFVGAGCLSPGMSNSYETFEFCNEVKDNMFKCLWIGFYFYWILAGYIQSYANENAVKMLLMCVIWYWPCSSVWLGYTRMPRSFFWVTQSLCSSVVSGANWMPWVTSWTHCAPILNGSQVSAPAFHRHTVKT